MSDKNKIDKTQITMKIWKDTLNKLREISSLTHEPLVLILHRLIADELERIQNNRAKN